MLRNAWLLLAAAVIVASCNATPQYTTQRLPSGREIKVVSVTKMFFTKGDPALMLSYQTDLAIDDLDGLRREAEEIWPIFRVDVERAQVKGAIISARDAPTGLFIKKNRVHNFIIVKNADNSWHFQ